MLQDLLLQAFERYHQNGLSAFREGDRAAAREHFLQAARVLYKLAAGPGSVGPLQKTRMERADKLLKLAQSLEGDDQNAKPHSDRQAATAHGGDAEGDSDDATHGSAKDSGAGEKWRVQLADGMQLGLEDVEGLEQVKDLIRKRIIYPFENPEISERYGKRAGGGVMLYGPPGTGKTMLARAIASEVDAAFFSVRCSDILSKWVGEAEQNLKELFEAALSHGRAVIFFDEAEALLARRGGDSAVLNRLVPEFLGLVDGVAGRPEGLLLLGATNRPWDLDEAAIRPGRFGEMVYITLPDAPARQAIMTHHLDGVPMASDIDLNHWAQHTQGLSGADLVGLCETATDAPYLREVEMGLPQNLEQADIQNALDKTRRSVTPALLAQFEKFDTTGA